MSTETVNALKTRQLVAGGLQAVGEGRNLLNEGVGFDVNFKTLWQGEGR